MRILLVSIYDTARSGGLSTHVAELSEGLRRAGHEAVVATPYTLRPRWWRRLVQDLPRLPLRAFGRDAAYLHFLRVGESFLAHGIKRLLAERPADVVHAHDPVALLAARAALRSASTRPLPGLVLTVHGDIANLAVSDAAIEPDGKGRRAAEGLEKNAYRTADILIAVDERLERHCRALGGDRSTVVFSNFIDVDLFRPPGPADASALADLRDKLALSEEARVILSPRRLVPKTGVEVAVQAMAERVRQLSGADPAVLLIAGEGPQRAALEGLSRRLGLDAPGPVGPRVRFLGDVARTDLPLLYRLAEVVLVPSVPDRGVIEATSLTALEAMATGRLVIASSIGGLAEIIETERTGILVPPANAAALARAIDRALVESANAASIGAAARAYVVCERSTTACVRKLLAIYGRAAVGSP